MMELSIVTGTYNRLKHLQKFVHSVRMSIGGLRFPYEIVLVDGGSNDGTIDWCMEQPDVVLVEQGKLLGAVKAFNAGALMAKGRYVVLANDDIEFIYETLLRAYRIISENQQVGIGCLYQNRNNRDFHVEYMPAIYQGKQISVPYGQVCILPKALGDKVGWWGTYLHTYGGDNELSCNVLKEGLEVAAFECCCINDLKVDDKLRQINNGDPRQNKAHPDTIKWTMKWSKMLKGMTGAIIPDEKQRFVMDVHPRVLYAPIHEKGNELQRKTKIGLYDAMVKQGWAVVEHDYMTYGIDHLYDVAEAFKPHMFLLQIQGGLDMPAHFLRELKQKHPNAVFVSWNGDYHSENLRSAAYMECVKLMDLATFVTADIKEIYEANDIPWRYWQIGFETSQAKVNSKTPRHDVLFMGNCYSNKRRELVNLLAGLRSEGINVGLYGSMPDGLTDGNTLYDFSQGHRLLQAAKIVISDQQWPHATGYVSNRLFQSLYAGAFVLQQRFDGLEEYTGFKVDEHLAVWNDLQTLPETIKFWLQSNNNAERVRIANQGKQRCLDTANFGSRLKELINEIQNIPGHDIATNLLCNSSKRAMVG